MEISANVLLERTNVIKSDSLNRNKEDLFRFLEMIQFQKEVIWRIEHSDLEFLF